MRAESGRAYLAICRVQARERFAPRMAPDRFVDGGTSFPREVDTGRANDDPETVSRVAPHQIDVRGVRVS